MSATKKTKRSPKMKNDVVSAYRIAFDAAKESMKDTPKADFALVFATMDVLENAMDDGAPPCRVIRLVSGCAWKYSDAAGRLQSAAGWAITARAQMDRVNS
jgi:hypothetical protein